MGVYGIRDDTLVANKLKTNKLTVNNNSFPVSYVIPKTATVGTGTILTGWAPHSATTAKLAKDLLIQPVYPCVIGVIANAVGSAGGTDKLKFLGYDAMGNTVTEDVHIQATAAGINYTNYAYAQITSITPRNTAGAAVLPKCTSVGVHQFTRRIGLPYPVASSGPSTILSYTFDGTHATAAKIGTVSITYNTISDGAKLGIAAKTMQIIYKTKLQA